MRVKGHFKINLMNLLAFDHKGKKGYQFHEMQWTRVKRSWRCIGLGIYVRTSMERLSNG